MGIHYPDPMPRRVQSSHESQRLPKANILLSRGLACMTEAFSSLGPVRMACYQELEWAVDSETAHDNLCCPTDVPQVKRCRCY